MRARNRKTEYERKRVPLEKKAKWHRYRGQSLEFRVMDRVNKTATCWLWTGPTNNWGYGNFYMNNKIVLAHRMSWVVHRGEIPAGMLVCHTCDVRLCCNPEHMFLGTQKDNMDDMKRKGRLRNAPEYKSCRAEKKRKQKAPALASRQRG